MWIVYTMIGVSIGLGAGIIICDKFDVIREIHRLDRECAADNLACAKEEHAAEALRMIRQNEIEAGRNA